MGTPLLRGRVLSATGRPVLRVREHLPSDPLYVSLEFSCWIYFLAVRTWPEEPGWLGWGLHDWRSPALHECGACHLAALLRGACTGTERIKRRKTESSRSLRAVLLPAERTPRRPLKVSASHTLLFQSVSGALRVLTRERAAESQRTLDGGTPTTCGGRATTGDRDSPRRKCNPGPRTAPRCQ